MKLRAWSNFAFIALTLLLFFVVGGFVRRSSRPVEPQICDCSTSTSSLPPPQLLFPVTSVGGGVTKTETSPFSSASPPVAQRKYLSYQPPGNGWNNQRIALENALVLAKLLNRTLLVHPLAPHELGIRLKSGHNPGFVAYNMINSTDLLPPASFLDLRRMSQLLPVVAINSSHPLFMREYVPRLGVLKKICHSVGFGYWVDQPPALHAEVELLSRQKFTPIRIWRERCEEEQERAKSDSSPIVRFVSDLEKETAPFLYFEQGTLFGMHIRFTTLSRALEAQRWVTEYVRYSPAVWERVFRVAERIGRFNAIQVRRTHHMDSKLSGAYWLDRMAAQNFSKDVPVFVATDSYDADWFSLFREQGFKLFFSVDFSNIMDFSFLPQSLRTDMLGIHEQCICEKAERFVASPASTFAAWILRMRGEVKWKEGLMQDTLHTYWIGHQVNII